MVEAAEEKQAGDIVMLAVGEVCSFTDYVVICSGESDRQLEAIWQGVSRALKEKGVPPLHKEGESSSGWLVGDFGSVVVHVFGQAERDYYQLDAVWPDALPVVRIQ